MTLLSFRRYGSRSDIKRRAAEFKASAPQTSAVDIGIMIIALDAASRQRRRRRRRRGTLCGAQCAAAVQPRRMPMLTCARRRNHRFQSNEHSSTLHFCISKRSPVVGRTRAATARRAALARRVSIKLPRRWPFARRRSLISSRAQSSLTVFD